jgi:hypothetical protein
LFVAVVLFSATVVAQTAEEWAPAFGADAVATYVEGEELEIVVVPAGKNDAAGAAEALRGSLSASSGVELVMDASSIGSVAELEDRAIVEKASALPVDVVAIVRVFPGAEGSTSVVTLYGKDGTAKSAFTAKQGEPLAANEAPATRTAGEGLNPEASSAVSSSVQEAQTDREEALATFSEKFVWFQDWVTYDGQSGAYMGSYTVPMRGKYREPLEGAEFYEAIERPDLAEEYRRNSRIKTALGVPAAVMYLGGIGLATWGLVKGIGQAGDREEYNDVTGEFEVVEEGCFWCGNWQMYTGIGMFGGAVVLSVVNGTIDLFPTDGPESRRLADQYNQDLAKQLGLTDVGQRGTLPIDGAEKQSWRLDISASPAGVGGRLQF